MVQCPACQTVWQGVPGGQEHQLHHGHEREADNTFPFLDERTRNSDKGERHQGQGEILITYSSWTTIYFITDRRLDWGPWAEPGETHPGGRPHSFREAETERCVSPSAGHRHCYSWSGTPAICNVAAIKEKCVSAHRWHGHLWYIFLGGVSETVGGTWKNCNPYDPPAYLWNIYNDQQGIAQPKNCFVRKLHRLTGHLTLTRATDVLWQKTRNAAIFCVHRIPLSCVQKPFWLLPWVPACQSSYLISVYSSWPRDPWWSLSRSHAGVITESGTIKFNLSKKMWAPLWPWSSWDNATQDKEGQYSDADIWTVDTSHDIHVSLQRD